MMYYVNPLLYFNSIEFEKNFVFNGLNGAVDVLNQPLAERLSANMGKYFDICSEEITNLIDRNYIFNSEDDYNALRKEIDGYQKDLLESEPYYISVLPTFSCNLNCPYCFEENKNNFSRDGEEYLECIINALHFFSHKGEVVVEFYGGEPLLPENYYIIEGVLEECIKLNIKNIGVITNGTHLKDFSYLISKYHELLFSIQITIDGHKRIHNKRRVSDSIKDSFSIIIEGIDSIIDKPNVIIQMRTNVDKQNKDHMRELFDFYEDKYGLYSNITYYLTPTCNRCDGSDDIYEADIVRIADNLPNINGFKKAGGLHILAYLYSLIDEKESAVPMFSYCEAVRGKYYALAPDGNIYSCEEAVGIPKHSIGYFNASSVEINDDELKKWMGNTINSRIACKSCALRFICGGGCALSNYFITGEYSGRAACERTYTEVKKFFDYLQERMF